MHVTELRLNRAARNLTRDAQAVHRTLAYALEPHSHMWAMPRPETLVVVAPVPVRRDALPGIVQESHSGEIVSRFEVGQKVRWSLIGNPTYAENRGAGVRGKRKALPPEGWEGWIRKRLAPLRIDRLTAEHHDVAHGARHEMRLTIARVAFSGTGTVTDTDGLENLILNGVGGGKAYGCGLLLVVPS